jgi:PAS domain S-box-containing protein
MKHDSFAARIAAAYFVVAMVWILFSDELARGITSNTSLLTTFQSAEGGAFVVATAVMLYLFVSRKIHQLENARQMMADSADYNELLMVHAADGLVIVTTDSVILSVNQSLTELTGYNADELVGASTSLFIIDESTEEKAQRYQKIIQNRGKVVEIERCVRRKDGTTLMTEWRSKLLPNGLIQGMVRDISGRVNDEAALRRNAERLQLLSEITGAFTEASDDYVGLAETIVHRVAETIGDSCLLCIPNETGDRIAPIASYSIEPAQDAAIHEIADRTWFTPGKGPAGQVYSSGKALLVVEKFDELIKTILPDWGPFFQAIPPRSILYVPMRARGTRLGVLILLHTNPQRASYTEDDLNLAQDIADRAALAISNAQLLQVAQRELAVRVAAEAAAQQNATRLQMLSEATSAFAEASGDIDRLMDTITHRLVDVIGDMCRIWTTVEDESEVRLRAIYDIDPANNVLFDEYGKNYSFGPGESLVGTVFGTGQQLLISQVNPDEVRARLSAPWRPVFDQLKLRSMIYVPLRARGRAVGVLSLSRHRTDKPLYTEDDLHLVQDLADRAGLAISNAQLLQSAQHELAERIEAERALELSEGRFRVVADTFPTFVWTLDSNAGLSYINKAWTTYTGLPVESAFGSGWGDAMHPDDRADLVDTVAGFAKTRSPFSVDFRLRRQDGQYRWMLSTGTPRFTETGEFTGFVGSSVDLTERREAEEAMQALNDDLERRVIERTAELTAANEQLRELDEMRSKFVAHVTHDLRNPVASLSMRLYIMSRSPERYAEHVEVLTEQVERLKHLIDSVLDLSRIDLGRSTVQFEPVDFNMIVESEVLALRAHAQDAGIQLLSHLNHNGVHLWAVPNQLAQVVSNLVGNAIHYTPSGAVEVTTNYDEDAQMVVLRVHDTGLGIAAEDIPHLFERFYRGRTVTENDLPGSGLGLSIVKEVVDIHQGRIDVESEIGKGTTFSVWLPVAPLTVNLNS